MGRWLGPKKVQWTSNRNKISSWAWKYRLHMVVTLKLYSKPMLIRHFSQWNMITHMGEIVTEIQLFSFKECDWKWHHENINIFVQAPVRFIVWLRKCNWINQHKSKILYATSGARNIIFCHLKLGSLSHMKIYRQLSFWCANCGANCSQELILATQLNYY